MSTGSGGGVPVSVAAGMCTAADVKSRLGLNTTTYDTRIADLISALNRITQARYGREFMQSSATVRTFPLRSHHLRLRSFDLRTVSLMRLDPNGTPVTLAVNTDYMLGPVGGDDLTGTYSSVRLSSSLDIAPSFAENFGVSQLEITGTWGVWANSTTVPDDIKSAAVECVMAWLDRPSANIAGVESGTPRDGAPAVPSTWDIPASAHRKFQPYSRNLGVY